MTVPSSSEFVVSVDSAANANESRPRVATLADGRVVVTWHDNWTASGDVRHRIFDADGTALTGETLSTASSAGGQIEPAIAALTGGGFVIVWKDTTTEAAGDVRFRVFDAAGTAIATGLVTTGETTTGTQTNPAVIGTSDGGFIVVWSDNKGSNTGVIEGREALVGRAYDAA